MRPHYRTGNVDAPPVALCRCVQQTVRSLCRVREGEGEN